LDLNISLIGNTNNDTLLIPNNNTLLIPNNNPLLIPNNNPNNNPFDLSIMTPKTTSVSPSTSNDPFNLGIGTTINTGNNTPQSMNNPFLTTNKNKNEGPNKKLDRATDLFTNLLQNKSANDSFFETSMIDQVDEGEKLLKKNI